MSTETEGTFLNASTAVPPAVVKFFSTLKTFLSTSKVMSFFSAVTKTLLRLLLFANSSIVFKLVLAELILIEPAFFLLYPIELASTK